jgi:hypothetical protein
MNFAAANTRLHMKKMVRSKYNGVSTAASLPASCRSENIDQAHKTRRRVASDTGIPWQQCPHQQMNTAARISGLSPASLYRAAGDGRLRLVRLGGRTLVDTASLIAMQATAEPWKPSKVGEAGRKKRAETAAQNWRR